MEFYETVFRFLTSFVNSVDKLMLLVIRLLILTSTRFVQIFRAIN